jgi:hypothetical protein
MESTKSTLAVALADERLGKGWQRSRTRIRAVAVLCSLLAALVMYGLFDRFRVAKDDGRPQRQTIAEVDLRIGNPAGAAERGEAKARADIKAGLLQFETFGAALPPAKAQRLKQRFGVATLSKGKEATLLTQAHADAYNRVMQAEIERKQGREALEQLLRELDLSPVNPEKKETGP